MARVIKNYLCLTNDALFKWSSRRKSRRGTKFPPYLALYWWYVLHIDISKNFWGLVMYSGTPKSPKFWFPNPQSRLQTQPNPNFCSPNTSLLGMLFRFPPGLEWMPAIPLNFWSISFFKKNFCVCVGLPWFASTIQNSFYHPWDPNIIIEPMQFKLLQ